jgi:hypothetical protein
LVAHELVGGALLTPSSGVAASKTIAPFNVIAVKESSSGDKVTSLVQTGPA